MRAAGRPAASCMHQVRFDTLGPWCGSFSTAEWAAAPSLTSQTTDLLILISGGPFFGDPPTALPGPRDRKIPTRRCPARGRRRGRGRGRRGRGAGGRAGERIAHGTVLFFTVIWPRPVSLQGFVERINVRILLSFGFRNHSENLNECDFLPPSSL